ncbi:FHA domain-containing protein [Tengunoibacter tsumagoiensis]|uniref:FHA domain-containing protein n=1 Tax=Tengunoibacter tsumagoiensis TaxID=2014871 RepID=A0A401ZWN0_9CHLR|nr:FHA domain-containing protein [Tengunoibacter tsumagoiensis]GCE11319.1 hypothetical protein KTT_11780 [Tengunoibacter tsumagoiensis]
MDAKLTGPFGQMLLTPNGLKIGRAQDNQLVLQDVKASGHHAELKPWGQGFGIVDQGSTNGTYVNEQRLLPQQVRPLVNGDVIRIGDTTFSYSYPEARPVEATVYAAPPAGGLPPTALAPQPFADQAFTPPVATPPLYAAAPPQYPQYPQYPQLPNNYAGAPLNQGRPQRSGRRLWIILGSVLLGVVVLCGLLFVVVSLSKGGASPDNTLNAFCTDLQKPDAHAAYGELDPALQSRVPEPLFTQFFTKQPINSCTHGTPVENGNKATATVILTSPTQSAPLSLPMTLIKESDGSWKISDIQMSDTPSF